MTPGLNLNVTLRGSIKNLQNMNWIQGGKMIYRVMICRVTLGNDCCHNRNKVYSILDIFL